MRILFTISVVAFVALLWASVSTAQYIRRTRARRKLLEEFAAERAARLAEPPSGFAPVKILPVPEPAAAPLVFVDSAAAEPPPIPEPLAEVPPPPMPETAVEPSTAEPRWPLSRHRVASSASVPVYVQPETEPELEPVAAAQAPALPFKRPPASVTQRPYSAYFSDDMGDLSDPEPGSSRFSRFRERFKQS